MHKDSATLSINAAASKREAVLQRIRQACLASQRDPEEVRLLAVSKTQPAAALQTLYDSGQRDFGENYLQEALEKMPQLPADVCWHFIGPLQSNKTRPIAEHFDWVHSLASLKHAERLAAQRPPERSPLNVCIQVNLEAEASKSGLDARGAASLAATIRQLPQLRLRGLMSIPSPSDDPQQQARQFAAVAQLAAELGPDCAELSLGMSADLEQAIAAGSRWVRIGTALFGPRPRPTSQG
ncbi:MAG: YggS family pyridoxal phosphate-dependent enzyme [Oceanococcaceae bacterium]